MQFSEFVQRLSSVLRGGSNTSAFTKSVLEAILTDEGQEILDGYSSSSFKNFYNGNTSVTNLAKKVNAYIEPLNFSDYIEEFQESVIQNLCDQFVDVLPDIDIHNAGDQLATCFIGIITEAAGNKKRGTSVGSTSKEKKQKTHVFIVPDINFDSFDPPKEDVDPFDEYLEKAIEFYSLKKTLINPEKPRSLGSQRYYDQADQKTQDRRWPVSVAAWHQGW